MLAQSLPGPGQPLSVAQALVVGSALVAANTRAAQDTPRWFRDGWDVLDLLAAGMAGGHVQAREEQFTAMRDAWLEQIRTEEFWTAVTDMLDLLLRISHDLREPADDPSVLTALIADLVDVPSCMQPIPARLRPDAARNQPGPGKDGIGTAVLREALALRPGTRVLTSDGEAISLDPDAVGTMREMADGRAQMLGRPLRPDEPIVGEDELEGIEAWIQSLMEQFQISPAIRHAAKVTGFMPPGRSGLPNQHHQDEWEQTVEDYLRNHPADATDFDPEEEADKIASLHLLVSIQHAADSTRARAAALARLREEPDGDLALIVIRMMPAALQDIGRMALLDIVEPYVRGVDGAPSMAQIGKALVWLEKQLKAGSGSYAGREAEQAASMAAEFYCVLAALQTPHG